MSIDVRLKSQTVTTLLLIMCNYISTINHYQNAAIAGILHTN
ncbi:MAG: hypothetical protein V7K61_19240 [Nostoc sp.]